MLNRIGRNLTFSAFKTTSFHRLYPRSSSSSSSPAAASDNSFAVSYFIDSCGFPRDKAISASNYLNFKTPDRADAVIAFLKNQGFTEPQISHLVRKFPLALKYNPETNLLPKFKFFSSIGFSDSDIVKLITTIPESLGRSLKNQIEPTFNLLKNSLQSNERTLVAMKKYPWLLVLGLQANLAPNIQLLQDVGVPASKMLHIFTYKTRYLLVETKQLKMAVEEAVEMGFDPLKPKFMLAIHVVRLMSKSTREKKMETYEKWGWSKSQIFLAFRANPWCMVYSEDKIAKVMDFWVNKMGFDASVIAKNSNLIGYSMEKRIIPRCLVYQYCLDNGLMNDKQYSGFIRLLKSSEEKFIERLESYETKAPGVLNFYREKLDHAN